MFVYEDLFKLKDIIKECYPQKASRTKTAIVVETGVQFDMANAFLSIAEELPFQIKVFNDSDSAEKWVAD
jgi:hypothetical protein